MQLIVSNHDVISCVVAVTVGFDIMRHELVLLFIHRNSMHTLY